MESQYSLNSVLSLNRALIGNGTVSLNRTLILSLNRSLIEYWILSGNLKILNRRQDSQPKRRRREGVRRWWSRRRVGGGWRGCSCGKTYRDTSGSVSRDHSVLSLLDLLVPKYQNWHEVLSLFDSLYKSTKTDTQDDIGITRCGCEMSQFAYFREWKTKKTRRKLRAKWYTV